MRENAHTNLFDENVVSKCIVFGREIQYIHNDICNEVDILFAMNLHQISMLQCMHRCIDNLCMKYGYTVRSCSYVCNYLFFVYRPDATTLLRNVPSVCSSHIILIALLKGRRADANRLAISLYEEMQQNADLFLKLLFHNSFSLDLSTARDMSYFLQLLEDPTIDRELKERLQVFLEGYLLNLVVFLEENRYISQKEYR